MSTSYAIVGDAVVGEVRVGAVAPQEDGRGRADALAGEAEDEFAEVKLLRGDDRFRADIVILLFFLFLFFIVVFFFTLLRVVCSDFGTVSWCSVL